LVLNKKFLPLLRFYAAEGRYKDAANLIRLIKIIFPDEAWNRTMENADDQTVLQEYAKENKECEPVLQELLRARRSRQMRDKANASVSSETTGADTSTIQVSISFAFSCDSLGSLDCLFF
uniref:ELYS domain-containing protein n=1 Tax=Gongylonema pulchrum TaxID=637853 RepID=A0A183D6Z3_9BILA